MNLTLCEFNSDVRRSKQSNHAVRCCITNRINIYPDEFMWAVELENGGFDLAFPSELREISEITEMEWAKIKSNNSAAKGYPMAISPTVVWTGPAESPRADWDEDNEQLGDDDELDDEEDEDDLDRFDDDEEDDEDPDFLDDDTEDDEFIDDDDEDDDDGF